MSLAFRIRATRGEFVLDVTHETPASSLAIVGPSGAGKTTLLQGLAGLAPTDQVRLIVDGVRHVDSTTGVEPPAHRRGVGLVFQDGRLFPHKTVAGNVGFARPYAVDPLTVAEALALVDLSGFETRWPSSLSGGEARRVAIARALVSRPRLLLLDEPFAGLDARRRNALIPYLLQLRAQADVRLIVVSHDPRDVFALAEAVLTLDGGRMVSSGSVRQGPDRIRSSAGQ